MPVEEIEPSLVETPTLILGLKRQDTNMKQWASTLLDTDLNFASVLRLSQHRNWTEK